MAASRTLIRDVMLLAAGAAVGLTFVAGLVSLAASATTLDLGATLLIGVGLVVPAGAALALALTHGRLRRRHADAVETLEFDRWRLMTATENMSQGLVLYDAAERIVFCNRRYIDMFGLSDELRKPGTTFRDLMRQRATLGNFMGDVDERCDSVVASIRKGEVADLVYHTVDGRWINVSNQPLPDGGWVSTHEDITRQRKAEQALERSRAFLNTIIDNVPIAIIVKDAITRRFVLINRVAEELWGLSREQTIGKTAREIFPQARADAIERLDEELTQSQTPLVVEESQVNAKAGSPRVLSSRRMALRDNEGRPEFLIGVVEDVTERKGVELRIAHLAHHDALTGLPNRVLFRERLEQNLASRKDGEHVAVLFLDLDNFKGINDTLGHSTGDELLKTVAVRLGACLKPSDTVCRLGGDEFAIVQAAVRSTEEVSALARTIYATLKQPCEADGHQLVTHTSIGVALAPRDGAEPNQLLKNADLALYAAKADGRGVCRFFEPGMGARVNQRLALERELQRGLVENEFEVFYQPIVGVRGNHIVGCEALVRWRHPTRGLIGPSEFITAAEETGLINQLGDWVLRTACREAAEWPAELKIAVNVSPVQFKSLTFPLKIVEALNATGLAPQRLELELTESVLMRDDDDALRMLDVLRKIGVRIAMDDFGTGYSSLRYLQRFPFDKIKIDRSFISDLVDPHGSLAIVEAVVNIAHARNIPTTAEGVETEAQLAVLRRLGCIEMQGHIFSAALRAQELRTLPAWSAVSDDARPLRRAGG